MADQRATGVAGAKVKELELPWFTELTLEQIESSDTHMYPLNREWLLAVAQSDGTTQDYKSGILQRKMSQGRVVMEMRRVLTLQAGQLGTAGDKPGRSKTSAAGGAGKQPEVATRPVAAVDVRREPLVPDGGILEILDSDEEEDGEGGPPGEQPAVAAGQREPEASDKPPGAGVPEEEPEVAAEGEKTATDGSKVADVAGPDPRTGGAVERDGNRNLQRNVEGASPKRSPRKSVSSSWKSGGSEGKGESGSSSESTSCASDCTFVTLSSILSSVIHVVVEGGPGQPPPQKKARTTDRSPGPREGDPPTECPADPSPGPGEGDPQVQDPPLPEDLQVPNVTARNQSPVEMVGAEDQDSIESAAAVSGADPADGVKALYPGGVWIAEKLFQQGVMTVGADGYAPAQPPKGYLFLHDVPRTGAHKDPPDEDDTSVAAGVFQAKFDGVLEEEIHHLPVTVEWSCVRPCVPTEYKEAFPGIKAKYNFRDSIKVDQDGLKIQLYKDPENGIIRRMFKVPVTADPGNVEPGYFVFGRRVAVHKDDVEGMKVINTARGTKHIGVVQIVTRVKGPRVFGKFPYNHTDSSPHPSKRYNALETSIPVDDFKRSVITDRWVFRVEENEVLFHERELAQGKVSKRDKNQEEDSAQEVPEDGVCVVRVVLSGSPKPQSAKKPKKPKQSKKRGGGSHGERPAKRVAKQKLASPEMREEEDPSMSSDGTGDTGRPGPSGNRFRVPVNSTEVDKVAQAMERFSGVLSGNVAGSNMEEEVLKKPLRECFAEMRPTWRRGDLSHAWRHVGVSAACLLHWLNKTGTFPNEAYNAFRMADMFLMAQASAGEELLSEMGVADGSSSGSVVVGAPSPGPALSTPVAQITVAARATASDEPDDDGDEFQSCTADLEVNLDDHRKPAAK